LTNIRGRPRGGQSVSEDIRNTIHQGLRIGLGTNAACEFIYLDGGLTVTLVVQTSPLFHGCQIVCRKCGLAAGSYEKHTANTEGEDLAVHEASPSLADVTLDFVKP
jgi:hypothetical protein